MYATFLCHECARVIIYLSICVEKEDIQQSDIFFFANDVKMFDIYKFSMQNK
jgi:hypothetical protein